MQKTNVKKTIENISSIPTLPSVIEKIARLLQNPQTSAEEVGKAITTDQALASKVLKLVNSAFYGFPGKIGTITHAIVILGFSTVKNVVLTASIFDAFKAKSNLDSGFDLELFWYHSIACAATSQTIARYIGAENKEEYFIAGLIHDIGKIILCQYAPESFNQVVTSCKEKDILFFQSEQDHLDITHQEIGAILVERWNLPKSLLNAVKYHHAPSVRRDAYQLTSVVHCADILVRSLDFGNGGDQKIPEISPDVWRDLGLTRAILPGLLEKIHSEVEKASVFMQFT